MSWQEKLCLGLVCLWLIGTTWGCTSTRFIDPEVQEVRDTKKGRFVRICYDTCFEGIIFEGSVKSIASIEGERYTPNLNDVLTADSLLYHKHNGGMQREGEVLDFDISQVEKVQDIKRQYIGYKREDKKLIYTIMINIGPDVQEDEFFGEWKREPMIGFGRNFERRVRHFLVDVGSKKVIRN